MKKIFTLLLLIPFTGFSQDLPDTLAKGKRLIIERDSLKKDGWYFLNTMPKKTLRISDNLHHELKGSNELFSIPSGSKALGFQLSVDQDAFYSLKNEDRDYTMGLLATIIGHVRKNRSFMGIHQANEEKDANRFLASFGFSGFTPYNLEYDYVDARDRPYAAIAFVSYEEIYAFSPMAFGKNSFGKGFKHGLLIGTMGKGTSRTAQFIQTAIHSGQRALAEDPSDVRPDPLGWKFAVAHNNSFPVVFNYNADFNLAFEHVFFTPKSFFQPFKLTVKPTAGVALGTLYDNLSLGVDYQFGFLGKDTQFGNIVFKDRSGKSKGIKVGVSLIGDAFVQGWLHNSLLNGILFRKTEGTYVIRHSDMQRLTTYSSLGGMVTIGNFKIGYSIYQRSKVMKLDDRSQHFGRAFMKIDI